MEALVSEVHPTYFMRIFGRETATVTSRAVATMVNNAGGTNGACLHIWAGGTGIGVVGTGTPTINAPSCGLEDNGDFTTNGKKLVMNMGRHWRCRRPWQGPRHCHAASGIRSCPGFKSIILLKRRPPLEAQSSGQGVPVPGTTYSAISIKASDNVSFPAGTYIVNGDFTINGKGTVCNQTGATCSAGRYPKRGHDVYITGGGR